MTEAGLVGREAELAALRRLIGGLPDRGGAVVLRGDAGIGKSSLLLEAARVAADSGVLVLASTGVESEARIPYAGLHQLLRPVMDTAGGLPGPQRRALFAALGVEEGPPPQPFLVALAVLNALADLAAERPVMVAVDDVHWLDEPTQETLTFLARRIDRDPILIAGTVRNGRESPFAVAGLPELEITGLDKGIARGLVDARAPHLGAADRARIVRESLGNPLALVELSAAWRPDLGTLPLSDRLERSFAGRAADLPRAARDAVLAAAVDYGSEAAEILAAASVLGGRPVTVEVLDAAVDAGLLSVTGTQVRFRHPLVRSAVLQFEGLPRRMAANAAMAEVLADEPYRRTWHRAQSILGPDDEVADELEASHAISLRRGSVTSAIWALERAAELTADSARRGRRLLLAAEHAFALGRADLVDRLLKDAARTAPAELDLARMEWLKEIFSDGDPGDAGRILDLCDIAARSAADPDLQLNLLHGAALRCWWSDTGPGPRARVAEVTESLAVPATEPRYVAALAVAEPVLRAAPVMGLLDRAPQDSVFDADGLRLLGMAAHAIGDLPRAVDLLARSEELLRGEGRVGLLAHVLTMQVIDLLLLGDWRRAVVVAEEANRITAESGQPVWTTGSLSLEAVRLGLLGEAGRALETAARVEMDAGQERLSDLLACVQLARGTARLTAGEPERAFDELRRLFDPADPAHHVRESFDGVMFFAEAAALSGRHAEAAPVMAELERTATVTPASLLHVQLLYARAVLADGPDGAPGGDGDEEYATALAADLGRWPLVRARLELAYGRRMRARRRTADARTALRSALGAFELIGAPVWAGQARAELRAAGERAAEQAPPAFSELSAQQQQIARLAAAGLSNREIGERIFLSPRTVGSHLYRIFPKLNISSRAQLASVLPDPDQSVD